MKPSKLSLDSTNIFSDEYLASYNGNTNITASELRDKLKADLAILADQLHQSNLLNPAYIAANQYNNLVQDHKTGSLYIDYVVGLGFEDFNGEAIYRVLKVKFEKEQIILSKPSETVHDKGADVKSVLDKKRLSVTYMTSFRFVSTAVSIHWCASTLRNNTINSS